MTSWVYVVRADNGPMKVGCSVNPELRVLSFQYSSPNRISLECLVPGGKMLEGRIKHRWRERKLWGEWFSPDEAIEADIRALMEQGSSYLMTRAELIFEALEWPAQRDFAEKKVKNIAIHVGVWTRDGMPQHIQKAVLRKYRRYPKVKSTPWTSVCAIPSYHPAISIKAARISLGPVRAEFGPAAQEAAAA